MNLEGEESVLDSKEFFCDRTGETEREKGDCALEPAPNPSESLVPGDAEADPLNVAPPGGFEDSRR